MYFVTDSHSTRCRCKNVVVGTGNNICANCQAGAHIHQIVTGTAAGFMKLHGKGIDTSKQKV
jgi:hypothetical protein